MPKEDNYERNHRIQQAFFQLGNLLAQIADNREKYEAKIAGTTGNGNKDHTTRSLRTLNKGNLNQNAPRGKP